ncbi:MAG TPA: type 1 glutamine amidotransferase domain-containing protein [Gemmatimonadaceae bacterium]|nr:type 1 glutamine amidotransferase domain-containing protein [Gemmatimonadaceae bacterium]
MATEGKLRGKRVAILATDGVEQVELIEPRKALIEAGATTVIVSPKAQSIQGYQHDQKGDEIAVDQSLDSARESEFDALLLPGGVMNPDQLRQDKKAVDFVRHFFEAGKPVAAICHGPWMLVEAGVLQGRTLTSWPSLKTDIRNAGGDWVDRQVITDEGLVTSRKPEDIPAFNAKMIEEFAEGVHEGQRASVRKERTTESRPETR